jgi:hypothetical protein
MDHDQGSEYFVDVPRAEMPHQSTWQDLNLNQLFDLKNQLMDKLMMAKRVPAYQVPLQKALAQVDALISKAIAGPSKEPLPPA